MWCEFPWPWIGTGPQELSRRLSVNGATSTRFPLRRGGPRPRAVSGSSSPRRFLPLVDGFERPAPAIGPAGHDYRSRCHPRAERERHGPGQRHRRLDPADAGIIVYDPTTSPFPDFAVDITVTSDRTAPIGNEAALTQGGTIVRTSTTGGTATLQIVASDTGYTTPTTPQSMQSSSSATFTNSAPVDAVGHTSLTNTTAFNGSPIVLALPAANPSQSVNSPAAAATSLSLPTGAFTLTDRTTISLAASTSATAPMSVLEDTETVVTGTNTPPPATCTCWWICPTVWCGQNWGSTCDRNCNNQGDGSSCNTGCDSQGWGSSGSQNSFGCGNRQSNYGCH